MLTEATGQVQIDVPRDRAATYEPQIVKKRQRRLTGVDEIVLSLYAKGLTTGDALTWQSLRSMFSRSNANVSSAGSRAMTSAPRSAAQIV